MSTQTRIPAGVAMVYVQMWYTAVERQSTRIARNKAGPASSLAKDADLGLLVISAAQFRRAVEFLGKRSLDGHRLARKRIAAAVATFDSAAPVKIVRDLDMHFDDYLIGAGGLQSDGGGMGDYYIDDGASYHRVLFLNDGQEWRVDRVSVRNAVRTLYRTVSEVLAGLAIGPYD